MKPFRKFAISTLGLTGIDGMIGCGVSRWCVVSIAP